MSHDQARNRRFCPCPGRSRSRCEKHCPLKPADQHSLIRLRDIEVLLVHLLLRNDDFIRQASRNDLNPRQVKELPGKSFRFALITTIP